MDCWYGVILFFYEFWQELSNISLLSLFYFLQMFLTVLLLMARRNARRALNKKSELLVFDRLLYSF